MAEGMNKAILLGNLCADTELRFTQGGQAVLNMRMATNESYLDKDRVRRERTDYHSVVIWGKRAEALHKILHKGSPVLIEGRIQTSSYDDREGNKRYKTEIVAQNVVLTGRGSGSSEGEPARDERSGGGAERGSQQKGNGRGSGGRGGTVSGGGYQKKSSGNDDSRAPDASDQGGGSDDYPSDDYAGTYSGGGDDDVPF